MSTPGQLTAKPPVSPHANLRAVERTGTNSGGSAIWRMQCTCGASFVEIAPVIRSGVAKCASCQPGIGERQARTILALLPATYETLARKTGLTLGNLKSRVRIMRHADRCHVGKWRRPSGQGDFVPVFYAGPGEDAPCKLQRRSDAQYKRKYLKRLRRAIEKAETSGAEDPRYMRQIAMHKADKTVQLTRAKPQTPFSALFTRSHA